MKFQVPQFIETETKLIGPFTLKQFLWIGSGGAMLFLCFLILPRFVFFIVAIPIGGLFAGMAFVRINGTPLMNYMLYGLNFILNPKQFIFKKEEEGDIQQIILSDKISNEIVLSDKERK